MKKYVIVMTYIFTIKLESDMKVWYVIKPVWYKKIGPSLFRSLKKISIRLGLYVVRAEQWAESQPNTRQPR
jgi:hypothetical protein